MSARSYLYVPGTAGERLDHAADRGADAVIVDLEDAVVASRKQEARTAAARFVAAAADPRIEVWVRVNQGPDGLADIIATVGPSLTGVCVPKTGGAHDLAAVDEALTTAERAAGLLRGSIAVNPLIESAQGLENLREIARSPRVRMIQIGEGDLAADLGMLPGPGGEEFLAVRTAAVVMSRGANIEAPMAAVSTNFRDLEALRADTELHRRLGFRGRACIHPAQLAIVHDVFTPSAEEVDRARAVLAAFDDGVARGDGAMVAPDGRMLDEALVRSARDLLALSTS
jgi:citrate lyase subunit beta/citryl-CoA lyase